ncbi:hypothetical protein CXB51_009278 [Gossypium anomalum]|uniref:Glycosyltransferase n=1 Tax=Gossypium anomalum TaxID=47600 RepID=A0A8J5Z7J6_9ROSI|nr:hypothetical protein CXB51_009278 [Gossypium anomalum]
MVMKAELVFIPMPRMGHFESMVQLAKLLVDLHPNLSITMIMKAELVFIPMPRMGHFVSMVQLAKLFLDLHPNLSITVLMMKLNPDAKLAAYVHSLTATRMKFIDLPPPETHEDESSSNFVTTLLQTHGPLVKQAATNIVQYSTSVLDSPRLVGFVLDMFLTPFIDLGNELGVPSYVFYTLGAAFLGFQFYILDLHDEQNVNIFELKDSDTEFTIPSYLNPVSSKLFPTFFLKPGSLPVVITLTRRLRKAKGIMISTFWELESHAISSLSDASALPVYPVGPILNLESESEVHQSSDIMKWLDEQPPSSVVFLCFRSGGSFNGDQVKEIAFALEQSGHWFLWSLRQPPHPSKGLRASPIDYDDASEVLPEGFLDRTHGIGKIIGWAPQVANLGHPAAGVFVSHCGWHSTLESIWFGVPIAAWPVYTEQQLNAFELVRELGLAVEIKMDYRRDGMDSGEIEIVSAKTIEKGIRSVMEEGSDVRKRVKEMSEKSRKALINAGSSHSTLRGLVDDVMNNMFTKNYQADDIPTNNSLDPTKCPGMHCLISSKAHSVSESRSPANFTHSKSYIRNDFISTSRN